MKKLKPYFDSLLIYPFVVTFIILIYLELSKVWTHIGGGSSQLLKIEIPSIILLLMIFYFSKINNKIVKYLLPVAPVLILYSLFDIFYSYFGTSPRPSDFQNYHTIFDFSPGLATGLISYALLAPLAILFLLYYAYRKQPKRNILVSLFSRLLAISALFMFLLSDSFTEYAAKKFDDIEWSQQFTIRKNGRFTSFVFYGNKEKENLKALYKQKSNEVDIYNRLYPGNLSNKKNIHIIVLESFIDPRLLDNVTFDYPPLATELKPYLLETGDMFSHAISPVYGGGTAQAEFELLTGIKALSKINSTEFNVLNGGISSSLVNRLKELNYTSIATVATNSSYYNSKQAYKSLGLNDVVYLEENDYKVRANDLRIFDGDAFDYSFNKIKHHIENNNTPVVSYVLGMYGHFPYERNEKIRPTIVNAKHKDARVQRIANQFYYRTKAIANYITQLISIDPESIIYVTSDHLPPLLGNGIKYKVDKKINISLLLNAGRQKDVTGMHFYEIPWLLWDILTDKENPRDINNEKMEKLYYQVLHESITKP